MFEILFIFGLLGLLLGTICEYLSSLDAFPTLLAAAVVVPLLGWATYLELHRRFELDGMDKRRQPVPPERFYWTLPRSRLRVTLAVSGPVAVAAWVAAIEWPAELAATVPAVSGWLSGFVAIVATALFCACATLYVRASQWYDRMAPWAVGVCRRSLYRMSENPDFLAPGHQERREEEEKTIY